MTRISVVILNWNRKSDTLVCLNSVCELTLENIKLNIVVVDNNSSDDSRDAVNKRLKTLLRVKKNISFEQVKNKENLGFAAGNNVGIKVALKNKSDFIMLLNNDTVVDKNMLVDLLKVANEYPKAGAFSPKIYFAPGYEFHKDRYSADEKGKILWYAGGELDWNNVYGANRGVDEVDNGQYNQVVVTSFVTGACLLIRKEALEQVKGFDEKYFMYFEDTDLSVRLKKLGWETLYAPPSHLWHKVAQSSGIGSDLNDYFITRNRLLFGMRYASLRTRFALYKESLSMLTGGRKWQKQGVRDFYFGKYGKGSWRQKK